MDPAPEIDGDNPAGVRFLSKAQLAEQTGLSPSTIQRYKDANKIVFFQPGGPGARVLFPPDAVQRSKLLAIQESTGGNRAALKQPVSIGNTKLPILRGPRARWKQPIQKQKTGYANSTGKTTD